MNGQVEPRVRPVRSVRPVLLLLVGRLCNFWSMGHFFSGVPANKCQEKFSCVMCRCNFAHTCTRKATVKLPSFFEPRQRHNTFGNRRKEKDHKYDQEIQQSQQRHAGISGTIKSNSLGKNDQVTGSSCRVQSQRS